MDQQKQQRELIIFKLGEQEFCVDIMHVREIRGWTPATPIPHAPDYMVGIINLRGMVLPVIDLAARLGRGKTVPTPRHAIIVAHCNDRINGLLVEAVSDILSVSPQMLQSAPQVGDPEGMSFVTDIVTLEGRMISFLSMTEVLAEIERKAA